MTQSGFCDVIEISPVSGWGVATGSSVFRNILIICSKFAIKLVSLFSGQSNLVFCLLDRLK